MISEMKIDQYETHISLADFCKNILSDDKIDMA